MIVSNEKDLRFHYKILTSSPAQPSPACCSTYSGSVFILCMSQLYLTMNGTNNFRNSLTSKDSFFYEQLFAFTLIIGNNCFFIILHTESLFFFSSRTNEIQDSNVFASFPLSFFSPYISSSMKK